MTASQNSNSNPRLSLPLLQGLLPFGRVRIGPDIVAGITLAALGIPEVYGYTKIIGTPVITGLYQLIIYITSIKQRGRTLGCWGILKVSLPKTFTLKQRTVIELSFGC